MNKNTEKKQFFDFTEGFRGNQMAAFLVPTIPASKGEFSVLFELINHLLAKLTSEPKGTT